MQCGISTSCFYPQETAEALSALRGAGVETVEIFLNTFSELELSYTERLRSVLQDAGMRAAALHPFTSGMETFFFASEYGGRLEDGLRIKDAIAQVVQEHPLADGSLANRKQVYAAVLKIKG